MIEIALGMLLFGAGSAFATVKLNESRRNSAMEHPVRVAIVDHLRAKQCASISDLCRTLDLSWGVAQHHLYVLQRAGMIFGARQGRSHIFFPREERQVRADILALLQSSRAREIVTEVANVPGQRQKDLCDKLGVSRKVFRHHLNLLTQAGVIVETKRESTRIYEPTDILKAAFQARDAAQRASAPVAAPPAEPPAGLGPALQ